MQARHSYLLSVFEKLGTPLLAAVTEAAERDRLIARNNGTQLPPPTAAQIAEKMASLLKSTTEMGIGLSRHMDLRMADDSAADGVRLSLAAVAAPLVSNVYRMVGHPPDSEEIDRLTAALQPVVLCADTYNAAADANVRLQNLDQDFAPADQPQIHLMALQALLPIVNAVVTFPFGRSEKDLVQETIGKLKSRITGLQERLFPNLKERDHGRVELALMRAGATLYSQVHFTEMSSLMFMDETRRNTVDLSDRLNIIWAQVDQRLGMLGVLAEMLVTGATGIETVETVPATPVKSMKGQETSPSTPTAPTQEAKKGNPMAFFAGKKTETTQGEQS